MSAGEPQNWQIGRIINWPTSMPGGALVDPLSTPQLLRRIEALEARVRELEGADEPIKAGGTD